MKNKEDSQRSIKKRFLFSSFFANLYYFFVMHIYVVLTILGLCVSIGLLLFIAELIMPRYVHIFNYSLTDTTFSQLMKSHRYHAAIAFLEYKNDVVMDGNDFYRFRHELADCYVHTGDYPKALEQYQLLRKQIEEEMADDSHEGMSDDEFKMLLSMIYAGFAKEEFRIYLKMGDKPNIVKQYNIIKEKYSSIDWDKINEMADESGEDLEGFDLKDGLKLELLQGEYILNPSIAIPKMETYAIDVANSNKFNPGYKLKVFSELIKMLIEQEQTIAARYYLESALTIVDGLQYESSIYPFLGDLSEHCYQLHDVANGYRLLNKYLSYIDDTYDESDIDYAVAKSKEFKYLEAEGKWDELTRRLADTSKSLREQITRNFTGMTSAQCEYFIGLFKPIFSYANDLIPRHPSEELSEVCFQNNMFVRGLLLRSETSLTNAIAAMGNKEIEEKYHRYVDLSQELIARQYISGPGNHLRKAQIEKEIASLETELATESRDFRRKNDKSLDIGNIKKSLDDDDVALQIIQSTHSYYALLLDCEGRVSYIHLGETASMHNTLASPSMTYTDASLHKTWMDRLRPALEGKNVYYSSDGIFNKISLPSLPIGSDGKILGDIARFNLAGSLADIPEIKEREIPTDLSAKSIALWGDIDYGMPNDSLVTSIDQPKPILRGDELRCLPGSKDEVTEIAQMLKQAGSVLTLFTGASATEKSFVSRAQKKDLILHISTHGFFHDSGAFLNPMQNAGLLFADSQKYWMNDSLVSNLDDDDGILRADEIARLDLTGCRLVVLSACQTGLGESNSEGVYGLQRAFKLAGAQSILMSLWNVDDAATQKLMPLFYAELISGRTPGDALTNAQNHMRRDGYSPDKWAAFVLLN